MSDAVQLSFAADWPQSFEQDPSIIYQLDSRLGIVRCNQSWDVFALQNGGPDLVGTRQAGRCVLDVIPQPLLKFYLEGFTSVLESGVEWLHSFECSSPDQFRQFQMRVLRWREGLLVINSLVRSGAPELAEQAAGSAYVGDDGLIVMCSHCRKTRRNDQHQLWEWVPEYVAHRPAVVSHGLCGFCLDYFYREAALG